MKIEREHLVIMAMLVILPFGLNGSVAWSLELLVTLLVVSLIPALIYFLNYRKDHPSKIGQLALREKLLTYADIKQILFCQKFTNKKFGEIAIERNYLEEVHVNFLLEK